MSHHPSVSPPSCLATLVSHHQCKSNYSSFELARARPHELREFGPAPAPTCIELQARVEAPRMTKLRVNSSLQLELKLFDFRFRDWNSSSCQKKCFNKPQCRFGSTVCKCPISSQTIKYRYKFKSDQIFFGQKCLYGPLQGVYQVWSL